MSRFESGIQFICFIWLVGGVLIFVLALLGLAGVLPPSFFVGSRPPGELVFLAPGIAILGGLGLFARGK